ncbi:MAG: CrcB family protein [Bacteroidia bacterium]|nr:CrcB family protein [Bacteroidia bacterium]
MRLSLMAGIGLGAVAGALMRHWMQRTLNYSIFSPFGTLLVNIIGSAALGFIVGGRFFGSGSVGHYALTAGFCGSLTTFSSITLEVFEMIRVGEMLRAVGYTLFTFILGMLGLIGGYWLGVRFFR